MNFSRRNEQEVNNVIRSTWGKRRALPIWLVVFALTGSLLAGRGGTAAPSQEEAKPPAPETKQPDPKAPEAMETAEVDERLRRLL